MKIYVEAKLRKGRSGIEARTPDLRLTSHGLDADTAIQSLQRGILAWCKGLETLGELENALKRNRLNWEPDGEGIMVEMSSTWQT